MSVRLHSFLHTMPHFLIKSLEVWNAENREDNRSSRSSSSSIRFSSMYFASGGPGPGGDRPTTPKFLSIDANLVSIISSFAGKKQTASSSFSSRSQTLVTSRDTAAGRFLRRGGHMLGTAICCARCANGFRASCAIQLEPKWLRRRSRPS